MIKKIRDNLANNFIVSKRKKKVKPKTKPITKINGGK